MTTIPDIITAANTIIIKIGTALIIEPDGSGVRTDWLNQFAHDVNTLKSQNKKILIVSSGAVAMGRTALNIPLDAPPESIPLERKQASSAIGQFHVFNGYHKAFAALDITLAQVLLTMSETENRRMHLNARATLTDENTLEARGYLGISLLGRSQTWQRVDRDAPNLETDLLK